MPNAKYFFKGKVSLLYKATVMRATLRAESRIFLPKKLQEMSKEEYEALS